MLKIRKVVAAVSGGVDSAIIVYLLKKRGFDVHAVFMKNWDLADETGICKADEDYKDAMFTCDKLKVPIRSVNFVKEYWNEVFVDLLKEYQDGRTPNPDVLCNRFVKFHYFYKVAREEFNADAIATGHYARTSFGPYLEHYKPNEGVKLLKAKDLIKDQTLFLCQINQDALRKTMFPLGNYFKVEIKNIARTNGLEKIANKKESMGICFIGLRDFPSFISEYVDDKPGNFINIDDGKIVGQHNGIHQWTLGQRTKIKGVPVAYFTAKKCINTNNIYVAEGTEHPSLLSEILYTGKPHWICSCPKELQEGDVFECDFKFQHVEKFIRCQVFETNNGLIVSLEIPRRSITPGQFAVFYKDDECVGSAKIIHPGPSLFMLSLYQNCFCNKHLTYKNKLFTSSKS